MSKPMDSQEKYINIFKQLDESFKIMRSMRPLPSAAVGRYLEEFSISTSHNSTAIEGNTFTYDETRLLLKEGVTCSSRSFSEHEEIVGYKRAFDFLYEKIKDNAPIDEPLVKDINAKVLAGKLETGGYRKEEVYIGDMFNVSFTPVSQSLVPQKMKEYIFSLQADMQNNAKIKQLDKIDWQSLFHNLAQHHIEFERIHPFIDGNGRTGRLLLSYELISIGLLPVDFRLEDRSRYYAAFNAYEDKSKYSTRDQSKTESMAKLLAESELRSMEAWNKMFAGYSSAAKDEE